MKKVTTNAHPAGYEFPDRWEDMSADEKAELEASKTTEAIWREMFEDVPNWSTFRTALMQSAAMAKVENANKNKAAVMMCKLIYSLIKEQFAHVKFFANQIDGVVTFTSEEKDEVNAAAAANHFPPVFGA